MNYIKNMNRAMQMFGQDDRVLATHVTLYFALFQVWNENRFQNPVSIHRTEVMKTAKISSLSTYTKCIRDLQEWHYLEYIPSHNPTLGSRVNMYDLCTTDCTTNCTSDCTTTRTPAVQQPYINNTIKNIESETILPPALEEVLFFFKEQEFPRPEAEKFHNYFQSNGWRVGGKTPMQDWRAAARNWMLNAEKFNAHGRDKKSDSRTPKAGHLHTRNDKDYSEPL